MNKVLLDELMQLSPAERIQLAEDLWDSIEPQDVPPLTDTQRRELDRRIVEHRENPERASPWHEVRERLWARYK